MRYFILLFVIALFTGRMAHADSQIQSVPVTVTSLKSAPTQTWQLSGQVASRFTLPLSFRVGGQVVERLVELGDEVRTDQPLARLDQTDFRLQIARSEADLKSAQAELLNAERERKRLSKLYADKLVSLQELQRAETVESADRQYLRAAEAALSLARNQLVYSTLKSPAGGQISEVDVEAGQVVNSGQTLFQLASGDAEVMVFVPASRLQSALASARAEGVDQPGQCEARLRAKSPVSQSGSLQYQAYYRLINCSRPLPLGTVVKLLFVEDSVSDLKQVPLTALFHRGEQSLVWQVVDKRVYAQPVKVVRLDSVYAYVTSELAENSVVVGQGVHVLVEGQAVSIRP